MKHLGYTEGYAFRRSEGSGDGNEDLWDCDSCRYPAPVKLISVTLPLDGGRKRSAMLCSLCAHSGNGNDYLYGSITSNHEAMKAAMFAANAVLDQLGAFDDAPKLEETT